MSNKDNREIKKNVLDLSKLFLGSEFVEENIDEINHIIDDCLDEYDKEDKQNRCSNKECDKKEIVDTAVNTMNREQEKCGCDEQDNKLYAEDFSAKVTAKQSLQIHKIVSEYFDTVFRPKAEKLPMVTDNMIDLAYEVLYEFACWVLLK